MNWKIKTLCWGLGAALTLSAVRSTLAAQDGSAAKTEPVRFKRAAWKSGDAIASKLTVDGSLTVTMSVKGEVMQHFDQVNHELTTKKNIVLAAGEDGPTKLSVHYDDVVETQQGAGDGDSDSKETSPLSGKTFVIEKSSKGVTVTEEDGTVVGEDIAALVREKELSRDGVLVHGFDRLALLVSDSPRKIGDKIQVPEELALEIAGSDEELKNGRMSLGLREVRDVDGAECAVFAAEIQVSGTAGSDEYKTAIELGGEILIRVDGARFVSAELSGQITVDGAVTTEDTTVTISGEGPIKIIETAAYSHDQR